VRLLLVTVAVELGVAPSRLAEEFTLDDLLEMQEFFVIKAEEAAEASRRGSKWQR